MKLKNTLNSKVIALSITICITAGLFFSIYSFFQNRNYQFKILINEIENSNNKFEYKLKAYIHDTSNNLSFLSEISTEDYIEHQAKWDKILKERISHQKNIYTLFTLSQKQYLKQHRYIDAMSNKIAQFRPLTKLNFLFKVKKTSPAPKIVFNYIPNRNSQFVILAQSDMTKIFDNFADGLKKHIHLDIYYNDILIKGSKPSSSMTATPTITLGELTPKQLIYNGASHILRVSHTISLGGGNVVKVYYYIDRKILISDLEQDFQNNLFLLIAFTLTAIFVTLLITQNIIRPIHQLISLSSRIQGDSEEEAGEEDVEKISNALIHLSDELLKSNELLLTQKMALDSAAIVGETDPNGIITYVNEKFTTISGYDEKELIGNTHRLINSGYHPKSFFEDLWKTISSGKVWQSEIRNKAKDGSYYWVNTTIYPYVNAEGEIIKYITIRFDITERKNMEEELIKSRKKTVEAIEARNLFFANMSHEIRTPLNTILGISNILSEVNTSPEQQAHIRSISKSGEILLHIVNEVLDITKLESGEITLEEAPFCSMCIFEEAMDMIVLKDQSHKLDYVLDLDPFIPKMLLGDQHKLRQVLINLLGNASKFTEKGSILLRTKLLQNDPINKEVKIAITVRDTGRGIEERSLKHIFNSYVQSDSSISRNYGGTGLGLTIVKLIIDKMGGDVSVESKLGKGSLFTITLPLKYDKEKNEKSILNSIQDKSFAIFGTNQRDSKIMTNLFSFHKAKEVITISNKNQIYDFINHNDISYFDYIFVDQKLKMEDSSLLNFLKSEYSPLSNSIVAILNHADASELKVLQQKGMGLFICRPFKPTEIFHILNDIHTRLKDENLLIVDQDEDVLKLIQRTLINLNMNLLTATTADDAIAILSQKKIKGIISDFNLPEIEGYRFQKFVKTYHGGIPFIMLSGILTSDIRNQVKSHDPSKIVDIQLDSGSLKNVLKPFVQKKEANTSERPSLIPGLKILIADDSEDNQNLMRIYFKGTHHDIQFASNGEEAFQIIEKCPDLDCIFMDIQMPVMNGVLATEKIRAYQEQHHTPQIPIIALTANILSEDTYHKRLFNKYLTKPIKRKTILDCIEDLFNKAA